MSNVPTSDSLARISKLTSCRSCTGGKKTFGTLFSKVKAKIQEFDQSRLGPSPVTFLTTRMADFSLLRSPGAAGGSSGPGGQHPPGSNTSGWTPPPGQTQQWSQATHTSTTQPAYFAPTPSPPAVVAPTPQAYTRSAQPAVTVQPYDVSPELSTGT